MKSNSLTVMMARQFLSKAEPEEMMSIVDTFMPIIVESLSKDQLAQLIRTLFQKHLGALLQDFNEEERAAMLNDLLPTIVNEFPMDRVDLVAFLSETV